ncbi:outer membrane protein assembly factor [Segetibacter sp. 3557_3]|uniref:BamA/OMP85 family outer membrane protein n=1 Tax=Segetibacter sp. 3557_3 TaxID=2547429 RepID=UPI001058527B|nr:POTRA domain-containing protein [Segetibacter sp. 3557_3]TDH23093.1 outer membrane protein assembly factor [Segetibacter sp. 3557_3]
MQNFYKPFLFAIAACWLFHSSSSAQGTTEASDTTQPTSVDVNLENLFTQKIPRKYKISSVTITGNKFFDPALLTSVANINVGDEVTIPGGDQFSRAINKLWQQRYFSNVDVYVTSLKDKDIAIEIAVTERPRLANFYFKGIKKTEQEDLTPKVGLVKGRIITENMRRSAIEAVQKYYADKGYRGVTARIEESSETTAENTNNITLVIEKGVKVKISDINFAGNTVPDSRLKKQMKGTKEMTRITLRPPSVAAGNPEPKSITFSEYLQEHGYLSFTKTKEFLDPYVRLKLSSAKFNEKKYEEDKEKLIEYYNSLGYRDATIDSDSINYNSAGNLNVNLQVNEGHRYYFGNITWRGNTKYSDSVLSAILGIQKGDVYNLATLNNKLGKQLTPEGGDISGLYMDDGYLFFRTEPIETAVYNDTIDHEIRVIEGPQATIKNVRIAGNEKTKEYVIRRELRTIPGEKFSRQDLIRSNREIANLGYFNQEKIGINPIPNPDDGTVDINYSVEEKSSDQLELSAGFGGGIGLTGTLGVSFNNFSIKNIWRKSAWDPLPTGDGQKLSLRVQSNGKAFRSYNFSFTEPWLGGKKRNSFTVSLYDTKFRNGLYDYTTGRYSYSAGDSYIQTTGVGVSLGKQLKWPDDFFSFVTSLNYTRYRLKDYQIFEGFSNGFSNNFNLKLALQRSSVDQPIFPRSGSTFLMSAQLTPPYSLIDPERVKAKNPYELVEYHKWRFNGEWYVPLGKPHGGESNKQFVLKTSVKLGYIGRYNKDLQVSPFERFQVGDAGLSNNFALLGYDIISHRGYPVYDNSNPRINPDQQSTQRFFTIFNKYTVEMRYPLSLNPSSTIFALGFFEAANGWYSTKEYNPFRLRRSVGLGMRFYLPMFGLLGFDYGIGLDRYSPNNKLKDAARFTFMLGFEPE